MQYGGGAYSVRVPLDMILSTQKVKGKNKKCHIIIPIQQSRNIRCPILDPLDIPPPLGSLVGWRATGVISSSRGPGVASGITHQGS